MSISTFRMLAFASFALITAPLFSQNTCVVEGIFSPPAVNFIGETHQGGIIFWLDGYGGGLIAAPSDEPTGSPWGCDGTLISGADGTAIGTGAQNTAEILTDCTTPGTAAYRCADLTIGTEEEIYSDWFLPSQDELNEMYLNIGQGSVLGNVGSFGNHGYWTSTENGTDKAWCQSFLYGNLYFENKNDIHHHGVRAVRAF